MMKALSIIVAVDKNGGIGKDNDLLFHVSDDLKRFKKLTTGHTIIMGRKTFESLPNGPLPNRKHIIVTRNKNYHVPGCSVVHTVDETLGHCETDRENFVTGGEAIYKLFLPYTQKIYLTEIDADAEADSFFPSIETKRWKTIEETKWMVDEKSGERYRYTTLIRIS